MNRRCPLILVGALLCLSGCDQAPVQRATLTVKAPTSEAAPEPSLPGAPSFTPALNAREAKSDDALLDADLRGRLRHLQHVAGERPVFSSGGQWGGRGDHVIALVDALPLHGVGLDGAMRSALSRLTTLRMLVTSFGSWRGEPLPDDAHVARLVEADHLIAHLWLEASRLLGATRGHGPEAERAMEWRLLDALAGWSDTPGLVATLPPPMSAYWALVEVFERYRALDSSGFVSVTKGARKARPGKAHPELQGLRARLAQEDPLGAGEGEVWDDALTDALRRARKAYQLKPKRKARYLIDKALVAALNVPLTERLATLELNLARWRRSDLRHFPYVIFVNLPDYHGEVWDGPERLHRFKIVIGNTRKKSGFMVNATPVLTAPVQTIVYNPYWTVPNRIYEEELLVSAEKFAEKQLAEPSAPDDDGEPARTYWEARGYEVFGEEGKGRVWVRRRPGPGNALGKVKFLFDNRWSVFLHDTPQKRKFRHARRAFSHGCMRVQEPLVLAELLLTRDGSWPEVEAAKVMSHYDRKSFSMKTPVWLVVDYLTTRVDADGRAHFFADVYRKDAAVASR
jgi:murein L,D-transpeptidase YcbB/YkuD